MLLYFNQFRHEADLKRDCSVGNDELHIAHTPFIPIVYAVYGYHIRRMCLA